MEKGKLKIFFGYCAGVGKTYSMLEEAQELHAQGVDVVIGYVEPHDRPDTIKLTEGLETLPLKQVAYRGITLNEFDIDEAIKRRPELVVVDELAHTNVEGSRNRKRYLDVEELLSCGINVFTTLNVQHIEGLKDFINDETEVDVSERIPDDVFDNADEVVLVDIETDKLRERMYEGKIYKKMRANVALQNFFQEDKLASLREIFMRRSADRIEKKAHSGELKTKILVLISPSPSSEKNVRVAARMAEAYHTKFSAMYVEMGGELSDDAAASIKRHMALVRDLGGEIVVNYSENVVETVVYYVKIAGVTNLILGKTWQSIGKKTGLEDQFIAELPEIEILIVPDSRSFTKKKRNFVQRVALFLRKNNRPNKYQIATRTLDIIQLLSQAATSEDKEDNIIQILSRAFGRSAVLFSNIRTFRSPYNGENVDFFDEKNELAVMEWCRTNVKAAGRGTDTLRGSKAIYFPIKRENVVTIIAFCCDQKKFSVTEKLVFHQLEKILSLIV